ncbi:MAG: tRNA (5-methylaminomethyl-2-thiouridine)(34)-methyltransferase MnmD [Pseudomonadota bacterium]
MDETNAEKLEWIDGDMPFSTLFGDHFYARQDGRAETAYVFLAQNGLPGRWSHGDDFTIGELGFGTGLNLFETWRQWREHRRDGQTLTFASFEAYPMPTDAMRQAISRWPDLLPLCDDFLKHWSDVAAGKNRFQLDAQTVCEVHVGDALGGVAGWHGKADAWYLDGFAPAKNEAMWSADLMQAVADHSTDNGTFATYTAAGWVRRNLQDAGFAVEKIPGHGTKRDMIRGQLQAGRDATIK